MSLPDSESSLAQSRDPRPAPGKAEQLNWDVVESTGDCVQLLTADGILRYVNAEGVRVFGVADMSALLNRALPDLFDGNVRTAAEQAIAVAQRGGRGRLQF